MPTKTTDPPGTAEAQAPPPDFDYAAIAATPEFKALHESRRRFTVGGTLAATAAVLIVFGLYGFAPDAMGNSAIGSVTWALVLGFGLVLLSFFMALVFSRASRKWDAMAKDLMDRFDVQPSADGKGRFER